MGTPQGAPPLDEAYPGADVRHRQQQPGPGFLCKDISIPGCSESLALLVCLLPCALLRDLKETSQLKSSFIHITKGGWELVPILQDKLLKL